MIELAIPNLRSRPEDIPVLAEFLCQKLSASLGGESLALAAGALEALSRYDFPGNVRELENILERAMTMCDGTEISAEDLHLPDSGLHDPLDTGDGTIPSSLSESESLEEYLARVEESAIRDALDRTQQNKTAAAKLLGITFRALRYKLEKLGID